MKSPFRKSKEKFSCEQDKQTGAVVCKSFREFEDGTQTPLAEMHFEFTADCKGVPTHMQENEEGALGRLEKKAYKRIQDKCKGNKPQDY